MSKTVKIPDRGDIMWVDFEPQSGKEIAKRRPAVILTGRSYNRFGLCLVCPITTKLKGRPFEIILPGGKQAALADQVKSFDWQTRHAEIKGKVDTAIMREIIENIALLLTQ